MARSLHELNSIHVYLPSYSIQRALIAIDTIDNLFRCAPRQTQCMVGACMHDYMGSGGVLMC